MKLHILGPVRLHMHGQIRVHTTKSRGLLGYLAFKVNEPVSTQRISEVLWDDAPQDLRKTLQPCVSRLRGVLKEYDCPAEIIGEHNTYCLQAEASTIDFHEFLDTIRRGRRALGRGEHEEAAHLLDSAVSLWRGQPLADVTTSWVLRWQETLTNDHLRPARCALAEAKLGLGDHESALDLLASLLAEYPTDESIAAQQIHALAAAGRHAEIPTFYRGFAQRLAEDVGDDPGSNLVQVYRSATEPAPAPAPAARPAPVPAPRDTHFTGRTDLLDQLDALLADPDDAVAVVALDGPPGVGKTTLATHWARRRRDLFPDGVLYADLSGYATTPPLEPDAVIAILLDELGFPRARIPTKASQRAALLRHTLSTRAMLVVLDNVRDSTHVLAVLAATAPCPTLLTSRQRLAGLAIQARVERLTVPAFTADEAVALLDRRLGSRAADDPAGIRALADLCAGLPLALRIVSEHVAFRPVPPIGELVAELRQARRLLDAGPHGDDHTTTLRTAFSWSYRALPPEARRLFRLLGLHPGTRFSVPAAMAVSGLAQTDLDRVLDTLLGAHLVEQEHAGRYRAHDLVHAYAAASATDDEPAADRDRATRRLFDWYLESARRARALLDADGHDVPSLEPAEPVDAAKMSTVDDAQHWVVAERANLIAVTHQAADLGHHEHVWRLAACLTVLGRYEDPRHLLEIHRLGQTSARHVGNAAAEAGCLNNQGRLYGQLNDDLRAGRCFEQAYHGFQAVGDSYGEACALHNLGAVHLNLDEPTVAITCFTKALAMFTSFNNEWAAANVRRWLGDAHRALDQHADANSNYLRSWYTCQKLGDPRGQAESLCRLAMLSMDEDRPKAALDYGAQALDLHDHTLNRDGKARTLDVLTRALLRLGHHAEAVAAAQEEVRTRRELQDRAGEIEARTRLGHAYAASGEPAEAAETWTSALALIEPPDAPAAGALRTLLRRAVPESVPDPRAAGSTGSPCVRGRPLTERAP